MVIVIILSNSYVPHRFVASHTSSIFKYLFRNIYLRNKEVIFSFAILVRENSQKIIIHP